MSRSIGALGWMEEHSMRKLGNSLEGCRRFTVLVMFKALGTLRTERKRTYLGFLWWFFEPLLLMLVFYIVWGKLFQRGGPNYLSVLLSGIILWQWFGNAVMHSTMAVQGVLPLLRGVNVSPAVFPLATFVSDSIKFSLVVVVLLVVLTFLGHPPQLAWFALLPVLAVEGLLVCGCAMIVASVVPFVPDLRFVVAPLIQCMFFLSGIFFTIDSVAPHLQHYLEWDPMAVLIDCGRKVLLHGQMPDPWRLGRIALVAVVLCAIGAGLLKLFAPRYPKLAN